MTITVGTAATFLSGSGTNRAYNNALCVLDSNTAVIAYKQYTGGKIYQAALSISGTAITPGSVQELTDGSGTYLGEHGIAALSSSAGITCYTAAGATNVGEAIAWTVSGTTFTLGSATQFSANDIDHVKVAALSSTAAVVVYRDVTDSNKIKACVLSVSGTTVTANTVYTVNSNSCVGVGVATLDSTHVIVLYGDGASSDRPTCNVLSISGTAITVGSAVNLDTDGDFGAVGHNPITAMGNSAALAAWIDNTDGKIKAAAMTISGTTITAGSSVELSSATYSYDEYCAVAALDDTNAILMYDDNTAAGKTMTLSRSGTTLTDNGDEVSFYGALCYYESVAFLGSGRYIGAYYDGSNTDGKAVILSVASVPKLYTGTNSLTERSDLPGGFTGLHRGAMCVRADGTVVVGCDVANSVMIAQADSSDSYATWTDITDSHPQGVTKSIVEV